MDWWRRRQRRIRSRSCAGSSPSTGPVTIAGRNARRHHRAPGRNGAQLTAAIVTRFAAAHERVGRQPMRQLLRQDGIPGAPGTVHRIMAEPGLVARRRRAWKRTTRRDPAARTAHMTNPCRDPAGRRSFTSDQPGTIAVGDITYLPTREGWLSLAIVLDLATRAVTGWALRPHLRTELVSAALTMAAQQQRLPGGAIFHRDRGTQYTSAAFQAQCAARGITQSMGATGGCWDNAVAESFFATLKSDLVAWVVRYIEGWYNRRRPHSWNHGTAPLIAWQHQFAQHAVSCS